MLVIMSIVVDVCPENHFDVGGLTNGDKELPLKLVSILVLSKTLLKTGDYQDGLVVV